MNVTDYNLNVTGLKIPWNSFKYEKDVADYAHLPENYVGSLKTSSDYCSRRISIYKVKVLNDMLRYLDSQAEDVDYAWSKYTEEEKYYKGLLNKIEYDKMLIKEYKSIAKKKKYKYIIV